MQLTKEIQPAEYILAVLSQQERLEIAFKIAKEAFKQTNLSLEDIESAVKRIRRKHYGAKKKSKSCR